MIKILKIIIMITICSTSYAEELKAEKKYKIVKPIYLSAWYDDLGNKKINKEAASAYLHLTKNADRPYIAFQHIVPTDTIMTIIRLAPKPWYLYFNSDHYIVTLAPDLSQGLEVNLPMDGSFEGSLDGLNPEIFSHP